MKNSDRGDSSTGSELKAVEEACREASRTVEPCETLCLGGEISLAARLELVAKNSSLTPGFLHGDLHISDSRRKILPHLAFNLAGNVFSQQLRARISNRQKDDVPPGQYQLLLLIEDLDRLGIFAHLNRRAARLYQSPMVESVADLFD